MRGIYLSFCEFVTIGDASFVGFRNYMDAFNDASFIHAFWYTALYAIVSLFIINVLAFLIAYLLTLGIKGANLFRTAFFMPNLIGGIVLGYIWSMIFNGVLGKINTSILMETRYGFWGLIILMCWQQVGYMMIIYIAGLQAVPGELIEAAKIDGANYINCLFRIIIPHMKSVIAVTVSMCIIENFKQYPLFATLTNGGPAGATTTFAVLSYDEAFVNFNYGSGAAVTTIWLLMMIVVVFIFNKIFKQEEA